MIAGDPFAMPILDELKKAKKEGRKYDLSSCRCVISSGVRWSPRIKRELCEFLPQVVVMDVYGRTEFSMDYGWPGILEDKEMPYAGVMLPARKGLYALQAPCKVINPGTGKEVKPGTGEIGEFAAGGYACLGFWKRPAKTESAFKVVDERRYFFTGDDGYVDEQFRFHLMGRGDKALITVGGEKVYSEEVKEVIKSHPKVRDITVVEVPDAELGRALAAIVQLEKGEALTEQDIIQHCSQSLPSYKVPKHVMFIVSLPRGATGKMDKNVIQEFVQSRMGKTPWA
jgi:fatty-acyl-CoA synthase